MPILYLDTETYSEIPLQTSGSYKYAENAEIIMWQYAIDDGDVVVGETLTDELRNLLLDDSYEIVIHNSSFDRIIIRNCAQIDIPTSRIFDTMACALAHGLPGSLDKLCDLLGVKKDKAKDKDGKRLISLFCSPQVKTVRHQGSLGEIKTRITKATHPQDWAAFLEYGRLDIEAVRSVYKALPKWNMSGFEKTLWHLDQKINDRGVYIDLDLAKAANIAVAKSKGVYDEAMVEKTNGAVGSASKRDQLLEYFSVMFPNTVPDLNKASITKLIGLDETPEALKDLLSIRLESSKTSTAKYKQVAKSVCNDGRLRGLLKFAGAPRTGRWSGQLFQPQNLPRPSIKGPLLNEYINFLKTDPAQIPPDMVMKTCASALRGLVIPAPGKKMTVADLSNIEGRVLCWLAGEDWKIKAFKDFDEGIGDDLYVVAYSKAFGIPCSEVDEAKRQIGKVMELAFGYQGGVGAWVTFAVAYGIDLEALGDQLIGQLDPDVLAKASAFYAASKSTYGLTKKTFMVCDGLKRMWRAKHPRIVEYWSALEESVKRAILRPGEVQHCGMHKILRVGDWLRIKLPSGRSLCYIQPEIIDGTITYVGLNQFTRKWERISTYAGKLAENISQAVSRDILGFGMFEADQHYFDIVLTVHDEIVAECEQDKTINELIACMTTAPPWATGLPLAAKGIETDRYQK